MIKVIIVSITLPWNITVLCHVNFGVLAYFPRLHEFTPSTPSYCASLPLIRTSSPPASVSARARARQCSASAPPLPCRAPFALLCVPSLPLRCGRPALSSLWPSQEGGPASPARSDAEPRIPAGRPSSAQLGWRSVVFVS